MGVENSQTAKPESSFGMRHVVIFLLFLSTVVSYATRVSMSLAIVAMTKPNEHGFPIFSWEQKIRDTILSSFFWGYIILQIPAGVISGRFGGKFLVLASMIITGVINLFTPLMASKGDWIAVCACRIMMGLAQGMLYPSIHGLIGAWAPITERSRMGTIVYSGSQLGTIIEMVVAGWLSDSKFGWPSIFYVAGLSCLGWSVLWVIIGDSSPSTSRWISKDERKYIELNAGTSDIADKKKLSTPWKGIWTNIPFWAILLAHCGQSLGFWTLLTEMPSYLDKVLGVAIKDNGILSALPYAAMFILSFIFSWTSDFLVNRNITSRGTSRKIFNTIGFWGPAVALVVLCYLPAGQIPLAVTMLTITVGLNGAHYSGFLISHIDLSPNYASTLMGFTNAFGNVFSIMAPLSVSLVVQDETNGAEWRKVFFLSVAFYFLSNLFFILFFSGEIQDWNEPQTKNAIEEGVKDKEEKSSEKVSTDQKF